MTPEPQPTYINDGKTPDEHFVMIAEQVPGFGGLFYTTPGDYSTLSVYLTDTTVDLTHVKQVILSVLNPRGYQIDQNIEIHPLQGRYDWRDLKRWYDMKYSLPESSRIISTDMQETENKLEFGVQYEDDVAPVTQIFLDAGVPGDAFNVQVVEVHPL